MVANKLNYPQHTLTIKKNSQTLQGSYIQNFKTIFKWVRKGFKTVMPMKQQYK